MFLGGWSRTVLPSSNSAAASAASSGCSRRSSLIVSLFVWVRGTFPRYRYDQIMRLGWKVFIPLTLVWLVLVAGVMQTSWNIWK